MRGISTRRNSILALCLDNCGAAGHRYWMQRRVLFALIVGSTLILVIVGILGFAHAFANLEESKRCFSTGFVHAQWPKWIGCAIATHEALAAGLIGAAGALLAAIIAADAVWQQIGDARRQTQIADQRRERLELYNLRRVVEYYSRLLQPFDVAPGLEDIKYVHGLNTLYKTGNLVAFFGSLPPEYQGIVRDAWERLSNLNYALNEVQKIGMGGTPDIKSRAEINRNIGAVVANMREHRGLAQSELDSRTAVLEQTPLAVVR
jgi:hypothetical protein